MGKEDVGEELSVVGGASYRSSCSAPPQWREGRSPLGPSPSAGRGCDPSSGRHNAAPAPAAEGHQKHVVLAWLLAKAKEATGPVCKHTDHDDVSSSDVEGRGVMNVPKVFERSNLEHAGSI